MVGLQLNLPILVTEINFKIDTNMWWIENDF